jgi:hypothetical protein
VFFSFLDLLSRMLNLLRVLESCNGLSLSTNPWSKAIINSRSSACPEQLIMHQAHLFRLNLIAVIILLFHFSLGFYRLSKLGSAQQSLNNDTFDLKIR